VDAAMQVVSVSAGHFLLTARPLALPPPRPPPALLISRLRSARRDLRYPALVPGQAHDRSASCDEMESPRDCRLRGCTRGPGPLACPSALPKVGGLIDPRAAMQCSSRGVWNRRMRAAQSLFHRQRSMHRCTELQCPGQCPGGSVCGVDG
jgi:hypothetical protein